MKNSHSGSVTFCVLMLFGGIMIIITFTAIAIFQEITISIFHSIKNDLYMINRNVLIGLQHDVMGEDEYKFYEKDVKNLVSEEIKRLWNVDVSKKTAKGAIDMVDVLDSKIINGKDDMKIETTLKISLRSIIFNSILKDKLIFTTKESTMVRKMRSW